MSMCAVQPEDGHYQGPKLVVVPYVENNLYSTNKYSFVIRVHTLYISYSAVYIHLSVTNYSLCYSVALSFSTYATCLLATRTEARLVSPIVTVTHLKQDKCISKHRAIIQHVTNQINEKRSTNSDVIFSWH